MTNRVLFQPDNVTVEVSSGDNLLSAAALAGIYIPASCGGDGVCGKCKVQLIEGTLKSKTDNSLSREELKSNIHLACTSRVESDVTIKIPENVRNDGGALKKITKNTKNISAASSPVQTRVGMLSPPVQKIFLTLPLPTISDNVSDMQRLIREIIKALPDTREVKYDHPELLRDLSLTLREKNWQITVLLLLPKHKNDAIRIIAVEPGDTTSRLYGLALDIGTTTMTGHLIDLNNGQSIDEYTAYNAQVSSGEDVISRIIYSQRSNGLKYLQEQAVKTINSIIEAICKSQIIRPSDIHYIMAAGNTVMAHLLLGLESKFIREAPYVPGISHFPLVKAASLGILAHPSVRLFLYPCVASYVGGDIVAGIHGAGIYHSEKISLYIDIGTNGEIVVGNNQWMLTAACSAGPAFEGGGIKYGMRASQGAIENFFIHEQSLEPMIVTVGNTNPRGICGSGLIAIVPELLASGIIDQRGHFTSVHDHPRIRKSADCWEYVLAWAHDTLIKEDIVITEIDIDNLIRAKGALFAGYQTLIASVGLTFKDIDQFILAGNFGSSIDLERAISIGLLPDVDRERFHYLGNGSLLGCRLSLLNHQHFLEHRRARSLMTNVELSDNAEFMNYYMAALFLPHTDKTLFPSCFAKPDK
ncbi:ASKHA domain-containing protein [Desulforhopalus singaporensis]|uniref:Uncharacterized 2Fe-2 and 4Fe-4S clusters-containing protein, contains DUF4445 domain n=1 Tax=Desulforhopalus singaporensis TaxID=91360 RepID=A0A1H0JBZ1_9BACT|nr:ASKHA domain-containing protein [Desulforhopalus singaporensis]SDO41257.1 Uncharacterized 2Fe-2 and 4Fe-4S clusters-containing protein, contains DUF4445 domain [Desulforhopalus singaporensis]